MIQRQNRHRQSLIWRHPAPPPGMAPAGTRGVAGPGGAERNPAPAHDIQNPVAEGIHALVDQQANERLLDYERRVKAGFDGIEDTLRRISGESGRKGFAGRAQQIARRELGFELPERWLRPRGQRGLEVAPLYGYSVFRRFEAFSRDFFENDPLAGRGDEAARARLLDCGFHAIGIAPCSDGRLAHVVSYVLRLPYGLVRRKAHAGALFDVSESVRNWVFVEHRRYREGRPNPADQPTRYLKVAAYHFSGSDPEHQGCAAHGSDTTLAAKSALARLDAFEEAIANRFCCGASVAKLLIGVNTDDDTVRFHLPDAEGGLSLSRYVDSGELFDLTHGMSADDARAFLEKRIEHAAARGGASAPESGMRRMLCWLIENNLSQIEYVRRFHWGRYRDIGHAERFVGVGNGFEEVQLRNLSYYAFAETVEEGADDVGVGMKIFRGLNVSRGLPVPVVIRCDYDGHVPGSKERAELRARRIERAVHARYAEESARGLVVTMRTLRDGCGWEAPEFAEPVLVKQEEGER